MIKRSVNTYMNAWTGDDFTAYPFATPNPADYRNLYQVYLAIRHKGPSYYCCFKATPFALKELSHCCCFFRFLKICYNCYLN